MINFCLRVVFCLILATSTMFGQIEFEPGYYVTNSGEKIVGQIGNELWRLAPEKFYFRSQGGGETVITIEEASVFAIEGKEKFVRTTTKVDISSNVGKLLTETMAPVFDSVTTFLLVHTEGDASLYEYLWGGASRFYLSTDGGEHVLPLICKLYRPNENQIGENNQFRQQLYANLSDRGVELKDVTTLRYTGRDLTKFLDEVNGVKAPKAPIAEFIRERTEIGVRGGLTLWTLDLTRGAYTNVFGPSVGAQIGFDFAILFPLKNVTIAPSFSPNFRYMGLNTEFQTQTVSLRYASVDIPMGVRVYVGLGKSVRLFAGGGYNLLLYVPGSELDYSRWYDIPLITSFGDNTFYGEVGLSIDKKYSIQATYQRRDIFPSYIGGFNMTSLVFGVNL